MNIRKTTIIALFAVALLAACATAAGPERDAWVEEQVTAKISNDVSLRGTSIQVEVENGQVLLTGNVSSKEQRTKAIAHAGSVQYVSSVQERLEVSL